MNGHFCDPQSGPVWTAQILRKMTDLHGKVDVVSPKVSDVSEDDCVSRSPSVNTGYEIELAIKDKISSLVQE